MRHSLLTLSLFLLFACGEREDLLLLGEWQASRVVQGSDSLKLDPAEVGFLFQPNNRYTFRSTLRYREAGTWRYENGFLYARDTTATPPLDRVVAVEKMTMDSLEIRMLSEGEERRLVFLRK